MFFLELSVIRPKVSLLSYNRQVRGNYLVHKFRIIISQLHYFIYIEFYLPFYFLVSFPFCNFFIASLGPDSLSSASFVTLLFAVLSRSPRDTLYTKVLEKSWSPPFILKNKHLVPLSVYFSEPTISPS